MKFSIVLMERHLVKSNQSHSFPEELQEWDGNLVSRLQLRLSKQKVNFMKINIKGIYPIKKGRGDKLGREGK